MITILTQFSLHMQGDLNNQHITSTAADNVNINHDSWLITTASHLPAHHTTK